VNITTLTNTKNKLTNDLQENETKFKFLQNQKEALQENLQTVRKNVEQTLSKKEAEIKEITAKMADRSKDISLNNAHQEKLLHDTKKAHQDEIRRGDEARKMLKDYERQNTIFAEDIKKKCYQY